MLQHLVTSTQKRNSLKRPPSIKRFLQDGDETSGNISDLYKYTGEQKLNKTHRTIILSVVLYGREVLSLVV